MWWGRVPFTARLGDAVRVQRLYTVVGGTPDSGYRQSLVPLDATTRSIALDITPNLTLNGSLPLDMSQRCFLRPTSMYINLKS
jgi:hypothetical protein